MVNVLRDLSGRMAEGMDYADYVEGAAGQQPEVDYDAIPLDTHLPVFVYGTLRPGHGNYDRVLRGRTVEEVPASLSGGKMWDGGFPYVAEDPEGGEITGCLIDVDPEKWKETSRHLDSLEGFNPDWPDSHYTRCARPIRLADGSTRTGWVYFASPSTVRSIERRLPVIEDGDWEAYHFARGGRHW